MSDNQPGPPQGSGPGPAGGAPQNPQNPQNPQYPQALQSPSPQGPQYPPGPQDPQYPEGSPAPYGQGAAAAPPQAARSRVGIVVVATLAVLALIASGVAVFLVLRPEPSAASEVFLDAAEQPGPDPFTTDVKVDPLPPTTAPSTTAAAPTTSGNVVAIPSAPGGQPGLYGGTQNNGRCDVKQLVSFLNANPAKAAAWVEALDADTTLRWSGGSQVQVSQIGAYVNELTPLTLTRDTRVTNHGYVNGRPTSRQAVLQRGTAVLIDAYGAPRVKCGCGNPLTVPSPVPGTPRYQGSPWPGWSPTTVVVVQQTTVVIQTFVIVNLAGPGYLDRPAGSTGDRDTVSTYTPGGSTSSTTGPSSSATTTPTTAASTSPTTRPPTVPTTAPPTVTTAPVSTLPPADFCAVYKSLDAKWSNVDAEGPGQRQQLADDFANLTAAAPAEVKADMEVINAWVRPMILGGNVDIANMPAEVTAAGARVQAYLKNVCGITG